MGRKNTLKMSEKDILSYAYLIKIFNRSDEWYINKKFLRVEKRITYFDEGNQGKQYQVVDSIKIKDIYSEIHFVFDCTKTMIGRRIRKGHALQFTGKGEAYKLIAHRLAYNQKLKVHAKKYSFKKNKYPVDPPLSLSVQLRAKE